MRTVASIFLGILLASTAVAAESELGSGAERCFRLEDRVARVPCLQEHWGGAPVDRGRIASLERQLDRDPATVVSLVEWAEREDLGPGPDSGQDLSSRWLDLHGRALTRIARYDEAVEKFRAALAAEDGTSKLAWLDRERGVIWRERLDVGSGRIVRAARAELLAGNKLVAQELLTEALALGADGWAREGMNLAGGRERADQIDNARRPMQVPRWFEPLPAVEIPLFDGSVFSTSELAGRVVLIDFWASWCAPCMTELPHLDKLHAAFRERGLSAVAVNAQEPERVALATAESLGLSVPIGKYDEAVDRAFLVRKIPTVIIADRQGRVRARWNGYLSGLEEAVAATVRSLLGDDPEGAPESVAEVLVETERPAGLWRRELPAPVTGLAVVKSEDGSPRIAAATLGGLVVLGGDGRVLGRLELPGGGRLVRGDVDADGRAELVGFRPGGARVAVLEVDSGESRTWEAPATLLDLGLVPSWGKKKLPRLALATVNGLFLVEPGGGEVELSLGGERVSAVRGYEGESFSGLVYLDGGVVRWLDGDGTVRSEIEPIEGGRHLVADPTATGRIGVLPPDSAAAAPGSFTAEGSGQIAVATAAGQLVVLATEGPSVRFRARWPGIRAMAAGDLNGDGVDELLVASGRHVTVLGFEP